MQYNVAIIGQSGVGKSSLINYLFGEDIRKTGTGSAVTERGFHPISFKLEELSVRVFDSWGLEPDKASEWMQDLEDTLSNRGTDQPAYKWIHSIFFCIAAPKFRVQDFELKIIKKLIKEKCPVTVLFTKADNVSEEKIEKMRAEIYREFGSSVNTIKICSVKKATRRGTTEPFGKDNIKQEISQHFKTTLINRVPYRCLYLLKAYVNKWEENEKLYFKNNIGLFNREKIYSKLLDDKYNFIKELNSGQIENIIYNEILTIIKIFDTISINLNLDSALPTTNLSQYHINNSLDKGDFVILAAISIFPLTKIYMYTFNYEKLCNMLHVYTESIKKDLQNLVPKIREFIGIILDKS
ncbi:GTPase RsgA [Ectobacillus polymachus]|uniref:GTPase RsgA n=1 Tax=Ectobacillus polymachus TaxID=1508806 RepID=UPI003A8BAE7F